MNNKYANNYKRNTLKVILFFFIIAITLQFNSIELYSFTKNIRFGSLNNPLDSLMITWHSDKTTDMIKWGYTQAYEAGIFTGSERDYHSGECLVDFQFPLLNENSIIYYKIQNSNIWGNEHTYKTSISPDTLSFSFTFGGDSRDSIHHWRLISDAIEESDFSFHLGDMVGNGDSYEEWDNFFEYGENYVTSNLIYPVIGNHDLGPENIYEKVYRYPSENPEKKYYSFEFKNTIFIILDSEEAASNEQLLWLEQQLYENRTKMWKIVAFHRPFYTTGRHAGEMNAFFDTWWRKFDDYGVDMILTSHTHNYMRTVPILKDTVMVNSYGNNTVEGRCQIVSGGYGAPLYPSSVAEFVEESQSVFHYGKITINDMELFYEAKDENNFIFDTLRIDKRLVINEINYNSNQNHDSKDWVEIYNPRKQKIDVSNFVLKDGNDAHEFVFPENTIIPKKGYLALTESAQDFSEIFHNVNNQIGDFPFSLSNEGELIRIFDSKGILLDSVLYDDESPWPISPNGGGYSLELTNWEKNNNLSASWESSLNIGTPGRLNSMFQVSNPIVINEINYNSIETFDPGDWVELYNPNNLPIDISNYIFMDENNTSLYVIPDGTVLSPSNYIVLCRDSENFSDLFPDIENYIGDFSFGLSGNGEPIRLYNTDNVLVDTVDYDDQYPWPEEPDGNGPTLELIDANSNNIHPENWASSSIMYGTPGTSNSVGIEEDNYELRITNYELKQNYPNPFNPLTRINYELRITKYKSAKIVIHNTIGQLVWSSPVTRYGSPVTDFVLFDGSKFNSGIYFYSLVVDNKQLSTRKMILLK